MNQLTIHTCKLPIDDGRKLWKLLKGLSYDFQEVPHALFAAKRDAVNVVYYNSGKLVVQGKGTGEFVEFILEPEILGEARLGYEAVLNPVDGTPRIGVDESGKGDFFGPLVVAGVYVNRRVAESWAELGIQDSKNIKSDRKIAELAAKITATPGCISSVVPIGNEAYNRLHKKMRTVNRMLAWGHSRVIENLLKRRSEMKPIPERVIIDQFARDEKTVSSALMDLGREIELVQKHKAEADLAVAAASILARDGFVKKLSAIGKPFEMEFPKGASAAVDKAAREFVAKWGADELDTVSKAHFRTSYRAKGLPEPPKTAWKK